MTVSGVPFNIIKRTKTEANPEQHAKLAWHNLLEKYEPKGTTYLVNEKTEFSNCQMNSC